ncbi:MAG TPA: STAS domain-containing protein [Solirubrobacterales bacterium]|nr:STAS domain-containing protein [Solirubrobacterales bacterium]
MPQIPLLSVRPTDAVRDGVPAPFACACKPDGWGSVCLHLVGELDIATCPLFEQALKEAQGNASAVSIDLQELSFIDCAGLAAIVTAARRAAALETRLILVGATGQVERLLDLTGPLRAVEVVRFGRARSLRATPRWRSDGFPARSLG